jgi:Putative DNA-binding domain
VSQPTGKGLVPEWLPGFQRRFGAMLRTPLDRASGTLRAQSSSYEEALCQEILPGPALSPAERLAIYNRQYWCRLFGVLQSEYPLTARLFGFWLFNEQAARFLLARAPGSADIHEAADGFDELLRETLPDPVHTGSGRLPRTALLQACAIDAAWRRALAAPVEPAFRPSGEDAARLGSSRLRPRGGWTVLEESWPLLQLRRDLARDASGEGAAPLPPRLESPQWWVLFRAPGGAAQLALAPRQAQLFRLLARYTVAEALARLEAAARPRERARLPADVRSWLAQSVELGFWSGIEPAPGTTLAVEGDR